MSKKPLLLLIVLFVFGSVAAFAFDGYVAITNDTGFTIFQVFVSHESDDFWGEDLLGTDVLLDGETIEIDLFDYPTSIFDVQVIDEDGDTYTFFGVDVAYEDIVVTLDALDL